MSEQKAQRVRLRILYALLLAVLAALFVELFSVQIVHHNEYLSQSTVSITTVQSVSSSRGILTDRMGRTLVSNRSTYNLTFDGSLLPEGADPNAAILRILKLCKSHQVPWVDNLPIAQEVPFVFALDAASDTQKVRFFSYLKSLPKAKALMEAYLTEHPELLEAEEPEEEDAPEPAAQEDGGILAALRRLFSRGGTKSAPAAARSPLDRLRGSRLTNELLWDMGFNALELMDWMRADMNVPEHFSQADARLVLGVRYELALRGLGTNVPYVLAEEVDVPFISLLTDGDYLGASVSSSSARVYHTAYAAHILGIVGSITNYTDELKEQGYARNDKLGQSGAEAAFESYLRGKDGKRVISVNEDGKITGEYYSSEPEPGSTVELTLDLDLQAAVEDTLAATVAAMNEADGLETRGAGAAVVKVGTGEVLAIASYPTYDLASFRQNFAELSEDPTQPLFNRATQGTYAPGSTLKPATSVAALESGATTLSETVTDTGYWKYPSTTWSGGTWCWKRSGHGRQNVTSAITNSCNYYFAEMGYRMGLTTLNEYLSAFGLGQSTGIEIGDSPGVQAENEAGRDQAPWAAFGQANQLYTPLQLANYVATLVSGGRHCQAHLLKTVKRFDSTEIVATGNTEPLNVIDISDSTLKAVKLGMHNLTKTTLARYFNDCVVSAGAKTGTAQLGSNITNNGVFVCFAPYEEPEIAVAIVIEKGESGSALASTAVEILNSYFAEAGAADVQAENHLIF